MTAAIAASVDQLASNLAGVRRGEDVEAVHQARVAIRRLRSDVRTFGALLDTERLAPVQDELRWFGTVLGAVRDLDVLLETLISLIAESEVGAAEAAPLLSWFRRQRRGARGRLVEAVDSERSARLMAELAELSHHLPTTKRADRPAHDLLPKLVSRRWRRLRRAVEALSPEASHADLHEVRILAKRCRYAADAVRPTLGPQAKKLSKVMAGIQESLGTINDAVVIDLRLREAADAEPGTAYVAGQLSGLLLARATTARRQFERVWAELTADDVLADW